VRHQVLVFDAQAVPPAAQIAFGRQFGTLQDHAMSLCHADGHPELYRLSKLDAQGKPNGEHPDKGTLAWHTDGSWQRVTGQATIIHGEVVPSRGGETHLCHMYGACERLSDAWKARITTLRAAHNLDFSPTRRHGRELMTEAQEREAPPVDQPVVGIHPQSGRRCLYLGDHAQSVLGMDHDAGRALIEELNAMAIHADPRYEHRWAPHELIVWDNRSLLHRATP
jgi:taurine dioxygenase